MTAPLDLAALVKRLRALLRNEMATQYPLAADIWREAADALEQAQRENESLRDARTHWRTRFEQAQTNARVCGYCGASLICNYDSKHRIDAAIDRARGEL